MIDRRTSSVAVMPLPSVAIFSQMAFQQVKKFGGKNGIGSKGRQPKKMKEKISSGQIEIDLNNIWKDVICFASLVTYEMKKEIIWVYIHTIHNQYRLENMWATFKTRMTFHYTDWFMGILMMAYWSYCNPYLTRSCNPPFTANNQVFLVTALMTFGWSLCWIFPAPSGTSGHHGSFCAYNPPGPFFGTRDFRHSPKSQAQTLKIHQDDSWWELLKIQPTKKGSIYVYTHIYIYRYMHDI